MSDLKVSCPSCGQHIAYDANWAGRQINCPTCQTAMTIPGASAAPAPPPPPPAAPPPPQQPAGPSLARPSGPPQMAQTPRPVPVPGPSRPPAPLAGSGKTSGLAIAALVCGLLSCIPLVCIAAVICGHLARGGIKRDASLKGSGMALAGLILGYVFIALWVVWLILVLLVPGMMLKSLDKEMQQFPPPTTEPGDPSRTKQDGNPTVRTGPRATPPRRVGGGMAYREPKLEMPDKPATGKLGPSDFTYEHAILENGWLTLRQGTDFMADAEIKVVLFGSNAQAEGKTYAVPSPSRSGSTPHLHMAWQENGGRKSTAMVGGYTMTLKFEKFDNGQVRGTIELETQKPPVVKLKGNFIAKVK